MSISFWQVRERLDHLLLGPDPIELPATALALLRVLLEHTWYSSDQLYWVNRKIVGGKTLAKLMHTSEKTVKTALAGLEAAGYVHRERHDARYIRCPDDIYMSILDIWFPGTC